VFRGIEGPQGAEESGDQVKEAGSVFRRFPCGREENVDQGKEEEKVKPPLDTGFKCAVPGCVEMK
jgi:hypothetical protein